MTQYKDYQELFANCVWYSDNSLSSDGNLNNLANPNLQGTKIGSPTKAGTDRFGNVNKALDGFSASNFWQIPTTILLSNVSLSFCFWIKSPSTQPTTYPSIIGTSAVYTSGGIWIWLSTADYHMAMYDFRTNPTAYAEGTRKTDFPYDGKWHFVVCETNETAAGANIWVDCILHMTGATYNSGSSGGINANQYYGAGTGYSDRYYTSSLGELIIFSSLLTQTQIKTIYELTKLKYLYPNIYGVKS